MLEKELHNVRVARLRCLPQHPIIKSVQVCTALNEQLRGHSQMQNATANRHERARLPPAE
jgi:hypothetical protein